MSHWMADVVIHKPTQGGSTRVTKYEKTILFEAQQGVSDEVLDLIIAGAVARKMSVFDERSGKYVAGTIDQLTKED